MKITIQGREVHISGENAVNAVKSPIFKDWCTGLDHRFKVQSIKFQCVDIIGPPNKLRVLFVKMDVMLEEEGSAEPVQKFVLLRGGAVAMFMVFECEEDGKKFVVLASERRLPIGHYDSLGLPAGMLDGSGEFAGVAAKEIQEEVGITIKKEDLIDMTNILYGGKFKGVYPSAGGCDEFITIFLYQKKVPRQFLKDLEGKLTGCREEGEAIKLKIVPLERVAHETPDMKALAALTLYELFKKEEKLGDRTMW